MSKKSIKDTKTNNMRSIKEIFVIGHGPSSSHTMGPSFAVEFILKKYPQPKYVKCCLYGSLASTSAGHLTDYIIDLKLKDIPHEIMMDTKIRMKHPNTMVFFVTDSNNKVHKEPIISIGGGTIITKGEGVEMVKETYPHNSLKEIMEYCQTENLSLADYVLKFEDKDIISYLDKVYDTMEECRQRGINTSGELPGSLHIKRKAKTMYLNMRNSKDGKNNIPMNVAITSFAVAEENAAGGVVVIAPTCGSAGVLPGAITYLKMQSYAKKDIIKGLLVAGLIGILCKTNGSVSGAEAGCQAEIGVACAMSAAMVAFVEKQPLQTIAQSAEIALEHSLGLTCDPVDGYVQIPCIERCAIFAIKAISAVYLAQILPVYDAKVDFDTIVKTMYQTGKDIPRGYKETSFAGLAKTLNK